MITEASSLLLVLLFLLVKWFSDNRPRGNIPGYMGVPLVGVVPWLAMDNPMVTLTSWSKKLGEIFSVKIGDKKWITLNSYRAIKDIFLNNAENASGIPDFRIFTNKIGPEGLAFLIDNKNMKKYLSNGLRNRIPCMEVHINKQCDFLSKELRGHGGQMKNVDIVKLTLKTTCNIALKMTADCRKDYNDKWLKNYTETVVNLFNHPEDGSHIRSLLLVYNLRKLPVFNDISKRCDQYQMELYDSMDELISYRRSVAKTLDDDQAESPCFLDELLRAQKENSTINDHLIRRLMLDITAAGTISAGAAINWCLLYLAQNPDLQENLHQEVTQHDIACNNKESNTPLLCSFIDEVLRHRSVAAILIPHLVTKTFEHGGKVFKKGDRLLPNGWAAHHDPELFEDPEILKPDRFILDGKFVKSKYVIPSGIGPRMCFGKRLAELELYLVLCNVLKNFKLSAADECPLPSFDKGFLGIIFTPVPFKVNVTER